MTQGHPGFRMQANIIIEYSQIMKKLDLLEGSSRSEERRVGKECRR
jgi:hypothetical protein